MREGWKRRNGKMGACRFVQVLPIHKCFQKLQVTESYTGPGTRLVCVATQRSDPSPPPVHSPESLTGYVRGLREVSSEEHIVPYFPRHLFWPRREGLRALRTVYKTVTHLAVWNFLAGLQEGEDKYTIYGHTKLLYFLPVTKF